MNALATFMSIEKLGHGNLISTLRRKVSMITSKDNNWSELNVPDIQKKLTISRGFFGGNNRNLL